MWGIESLSSQMRTINNLLNHRRLPPEGLSEAYVEHILSIISAMDCNNSEGNMGVGEREGRVWSPMVRRRNFNLAHGIGRSGDITALQPKAAGSSLLAVLTRYLALDALRLCGLKAAKEATVLPVCTGMALALCLRTAALSQGQNAKFVVWSRVDQRSVFK
eukprot:Selendium_serpulae@DN7230_c0_g1_i1.p2